VPPLRERPEDVALLAHAFIGRHAPERKIALSRGALELLQRQPGEGNARELENAIERALLLASGSEILPADLPFAEAAGSPSSAREPAPDLLEAAVGRQLSLHELTAAYTDRILELVKGNKVKAARILGINRRTLYRRNGARAQRAAQRREKES